VAILAEKYATDYTWYVDVILNLIRIAGDYVSEEVWYRVIQIVINRDDVQGYAAKTVFEVFFLFIVIVRIISLIELMVFLGITSTCLSREYGKSWWLYPWRVWQFDCW
jgi:hypothetical protein